jgi:predicted  nucleic acid-binding Zn-ribbon protein
MTLLSEATRVTLGQEILEVSKQIESLQAQLLDRQNKLADLKKTVDEGEFTSADKAEVAATVESLS